jgi:hypothetical protein
MGTDRCTASRTGCQTSEGTECETALISYGVLWPAVFEEFVPYALGGTALLVIGQAAVKLDCANSPRLPSLVGCGNSPILSAIAL